MSVDEEPAQDRPDPSLFRFEAMWLEEKDFLEIVEGGQEQSGPSVQNTSFTGRLALVHEHLHR